jgi:hypothetical protein
MILCYFLAVTRVQLKAAHRPLPNPQFPAPTTHQAPRGRAASSFDLFGDLTDAESPCCRLPPGVRPPARASTHVVARGATAPLATRRPARRRGRRPVASAPLAAAACGAACCRSTRLDWGVFTSQKVGKKLL